MRKNNEISNIFNEIADLLEIKGENTFRIRAYRRAGQNIEGLSQDVAELSNEELLDVPGIGHDLADKIREYITTGKISSFEELKKNVPEELVEILSVPGLGPKTARLIYERLNIRSIAELEHLALEHKLQRLPGIKEKTEQNILKGIKMVRRGKERQPLGKILPLASDIVGYLKKNSNVNQISLAGSLRRYKDTVKDIDILVSSSNHDNIMKTFVNLPHVEQVLMQGPTKSSVIIKEGIQVDLRVVEDESFGSALAYFTGSKEHNVRLREMAVKRGLRINEYGVFREKDNKRIGGRDEEDIYKILGLPFIQPELREDTGEIEAAQNNSLPELIELPDIRGDLHVHTSESDGQHTLEELVAAARQRGYAYLAVTDHSKGLAIARGLNEYRVLEQKKMIAFLNKKLRGFRLLSGIEVDIKSDGSLDFGDDILKQLDFVVAAIHSGFRQSREQLTKRTIAAVRNPYVSVIAHPTGRLLGEREAYEIDMDEILDAASETGTALEINAYPMRLDLSDLNARAAKLKKVPIIISTDAHIINQLDYMVLGVSVARRAWLTKGDVLNTYGFSQMLRKLKSKASNLGLHS